MKYLALGFNVQRHYDETMELYDILVASARAGLKDQRGDGSMPGGHNGPWNDAETPVRTTSHWLMTFLKAYGITKDGAFLRAANDAIEFLMSEEARPHGETFHHRVNPEKDRCNGLIGQAWTIEALASASADLDCAPAGDLAEDVFLLHPFDERVGLWKTVEIDGEVLEYDTTFNHQLWFAAAGAELGGQEVHRRVQIFLDTLMQNVSLYDSGLIYHKVSTEFGIWGHFDMIRGGDLLDLRIRTLKDVARHLKPGNGYSEEVAYRSVGYHSFNTYAFAILKEIFPAHDFWETDTMRAMLQYSHSAEYEAALKHNEYGYPYNPPGFENAYTYHVFADNSNSAQISWVHEQLDRTYDFDTDLMESVETDPTTYAARLYEATRLPNYDVDFSI